MQLLVHAMQSPRIAVSSVLGVVPGTSQCTAACLAPSPPLVPPPRSEQNPEGYCVVAVAENRQTIDVLQERLARIQPVARSAFFYDDFAGIARMRVATARLLERTFMKVWVFRV